MARLIVEEGPEIGAEFEVSDLTRIGRLAHLEVTLAGDRSVSREHAVIRRVRGRYFVLDLGSRGGTLVNRAPVKQALLRSGDRIQVGDSVLLFLEADGAPAPPPDGSSEAGTSLAQRAEAARAPAETGEEQGGEVAAGAPSEADEEEPGETEQEAPEGVDAAPPGAEAPTRGPAAPEAGPERDAGLEAAIEAGRKKAAVRRASFEAALFALLLVLVFLAASTLTRVILRLLA